MSLLLINPAEKPHSICVLRLSAIGDVCHAVSSVQALQRTYPQAKITWVIGKVEEKLIGDLPGIDFVIFDKSLGIKAYRKVPQEMKEPELDVLLHMQLAFRANLAAFFIPAKVKIGFEKEDKKKLFEYWNEILENNEIFCKTLFATLSSIIVEFTLSKFLIEIELVFILVNFSRNIIIFVIC